MSDVIETLEDLARSAIIIFIGTLLGRALALVGEALIVRSLPPEEYGHLALSYTVVMLTARITLFGVNNGVTRLMSAQEARNDRNQILQHGYLLVLVTGLLASLALGLSRDIIAQIMNDPQLTSFLLIFVPFIIFYPIGHVSYSALRAENRSVAAVLSHDLGRRMIPLALLGGALFFGLPTIGAIAYWLGVPLVLALFALYFLRDIFTVQDFFKIPDKEIFRQLWSFSWPLAFSTFIFIFLSNFDILMIGYFLESTSVGYYRAIQPLQQAATLVLGAFSFLYLPIATQYYEREDMEGLKELYIVSTKWALTGTFPLILVFGLFANDIVRTFFGSAYLPAASALTILVLGLFFRTVVGLNGDMVQATDRTKIELGSSAVGLIINFVLNIVLIPRYGINGAAIATVAGYFIYNAIEVAAVYSTTGAHPFGINNFKPLVPTLLIALGIAKITTNYRLGLAGLISIGICLTIVQLLSIVLTRSVGPADIHIIEQIEKQTGINLQRLKSLSGN